MKDNDLNDYLNPDAPLSDMFLTQGPPPEENASDMFLTDSPTNPLLQVNNQFSVDTEDSMFLEDYHDPRSVNIEEVKAQRQPWIAKFGAGVGRVGLKVASEVAKIPGVLGGLGAGTMGQIHDGLSGEDNTDFMETAFNNAWINTVQDAEDTLKHELLPVHIREKVENGGFWDAATSMDFYATEGADGIGYLVSMLVPGAILNKAKIGEKVVRGLGRMVKAGSKTDEAIKLLTKTDDLATGLGKYGITPKNIDLHTNTIANTLFEAGAEAKGGMDAYEAELERRSLLSPEDPEFLDPISFREMMEKKSEVGRNILLSNAAILYGPNMMMSKMIWGKSLNKAKNISMKDGLFQSVPKLTGGQKAVEAGKGLLKGSLSEGAFEEGMQMVTENYFTNPDNMQGSFTDQMGGFVGSLVESYMDMAGSTEGQKAMFLGALMGGGMTGYHSVKEEAGSIDKANSLVSYANDMVKSANDFYAQDIYEMKDGKIVYEQDSEGTLKPKLNLAKFQSAIQGLNMVEEQSELFNKALEEGDMETVDYIEEAIHNQMILPFIVNEEMGLEALTQYVNSSKELANHSKQLGNRPSEVANRIIEKAKTAKTYYETYSNFAPALVNVDSKLSDNELQHFYNQRATSYVNSALLEDFFKAKKETAEQRLQALNKEYGVQERVDEDYYKEASKKFEKKSIWANDIFEDPSKSLEDIVAELKTDDKQAEKLLKQDLRYYQTLAQLEENTRVSEQAREAKLQHWGKGNLTKELKRQEKEVADTKAKLEKEAAERDSFIDKLKKATKETIDSLAKKARELGLGKMFKDKKTELFKEGKKDVEDNNERTREQIRAHNVLVMEIAQTRSINEEIPLNELQDLFVNDRFKKPGVKFTKRFAGNNLSYEELADLSNFKITLTDNKGSSVTVDIVDPDSVTKDKPSDKKNVKNIEGEPISANREKAKKQAETAAKKRNDLGEVGFDAQIITTNDKGEKYSYVSQDALDFERNPVNKKGRKFGLAVNPQYEGNLSSTLEGQTLIKFKKEGVTADNLEIMVLHLPLSVSMGESGILAPLPIGKVGMENDNKNYMQSTGLMKKNILTHLLGQNLSVAEQQKALSEYKVEVKNQKGGEINMSENVKNQNSVQDLFDYQGDLDNLVKKRKNSFIYTNAKGAFTNLNGKPVTYSIQYGSQAGNIYVKTKDAKGNEVPIKLNMQRVSDPGKLGKEGKVVLDVYNKIIDTHKANLEKNPKATKEEKIELLKQAKAVTVADAKLTKEVKEVFGDNVAGAIRKGARSIEDLTLEDVYSFVMYEGGNNAIRITYDGKVQAGTGNEAYGKEYTKEELNEGDTFLGILNTLKKRRQVDLEKFTENKEYAKYMLENKVISTNVSAGKVDGQYQHTFTGNTRIYLDKNSISFNGKSIDPKAKLKEIVLKKGDLNPKLTSTVPKLDEEGKFYELDYFNKSLGKKMRKFYDRVSRLKPEFKGKSNVSTPAAATRGTFMDSLFRQFFKNPTMDLERFKSMANQEFAAKYKYNKKKNPNGILISDTNKVFEETFKIYQDFANLVAAKGWKIYTEDLTLTGVVAGKNIAGTVDALAIDKDGNYIIIDLKTSNSMRSRDYNNSSYDTQKGDATQLAVYKHLLAKKLGLSKTQISRIGTFILPLHMPGKALGTNVKRVFEGVTVNTGNNVKDMMLTPGKMTEAFKEAEGRAKELDGKPDLDLEVTKKQPKKQPKPAEKDVSSQEITVEHNGRSYTVKGDKIFNKNDKEVYSKTSKTRTAILAKAKKETHTPEDNRGNEEFNDAIAKLKEIGDEKGGWIYHQRKALIPAQRALISLGIDANTAAAKYMEIKQSVKSMGELIAAIKKAAPKPEDTGSKKEFVTPTADTEWGRLSIALDNAKTLVGTDQLKAIKKVAGTILQSKSKAFLDGVKNSLSSAEPVEIYAKQIEKLQDYLQEYQEAFKENKEKCK
jgi:hypothetical protein